MELSNIPTDSIYKFSAIIGLILLIAPLYILHIRVEQEYDNVRMREYQVNKMGVENIFIEKELTVLEAEFKTKIKSESHEVKTDREISTNWFSPKDVRKGLDVNFKTYKPINKYSNDTLVLKTVSLLNQKSRHLLQNRLNLNTEFIIDNYYSFNTKALQISAGISMLIGTFLMIFGFKLWYKREEKKKKKQKKQKKKS